MSAHVPAAIRGTGRSYANGLETLEIWVPLDQAQGLPNVLGKPVPIKLQILNAEYDAKLRSTSKNRYAWISPTVFSPNGERRTLAETLVTAGFSKNDKVLLRIDGRRISILRSNANSTIDGGQLAAVEQQLEEAGFFDPNSITDARERVLSSIVRRRGQPSFRQRLLAAYDGQCTITGCNVDAVLEAAHILPYRGEETNDPRNGLLLRADMHVLFDLLLVAIDVPTMTVLISPSLLSSPYAKYEGTSIRIPTDPHGRPRQEALDQHRRESGLRPGN